ncbi:unnamed protein product [Meganyctiphanes norvegica]|uniref:Sodefrin-like factor n=1 Tax=Meganyctiphanes norvegica TaxID=48144 RepID=A0AAV2RI20_MEGNR
MAAYKLIIMMTMLYFIIGTADADIDRYCYYCSSDKNDHRYDPDCDQPYYNATIETYSFQVTGCAMIMYDSGIMFRVFENVRHSSMDLACQPVNSEAYGNGTRCWCPHDLCNTYLCEECFETSTTTSDITTATTTTTAIETSYTTTTQGPDSKGLSCYNCIDCPTVDEHTSVETDEKYLTCVTVLKSPDTVIRTGGLEPYAHGECYVDGTLIFCHCTTPLCNGADV